jgi:non-canonical (house-cleaning) NTP pyrophosphatase
MAVNSSLSSALSSIRVIAVGSTNPVKVGAVREVFAGLAPLATIEGFAVDTTVPEQPFGDDETIRGALARAVAARDAAHADLGIGIEGGVSISPMAACVRARGLPSSIGMTE